MIPSAGDNSLWAVPYQSFTSPRIKPLTVLTDEYLGTPKLAEAMTHQSLSHNQIQARPEITFAYYPFLCINNLSSLHIDDINYLDSQGCFKLPESSCLDHLVRAFFHHTHPILLVVNKAEFWSVYDPLTSGGKTSRIPVILLSTMLFVACRVRPQLMTGRLFTNRDLQYVDGDVLQGMQHSTAHEARDSFLRKTQLSSTLDAAQASVYMLTYAFSVSTTRRLSHHQSSLLKYLFCLHTGPHKKAQELIDRALNSLVGQFIILRMLFTSSRFRHQSKVNPARAILGVCGGVASSVTDFTACTPGGRS